MHFQDQVAIINGSASGIGLSVGKPEDVTAAIAFLASPEAAFIQGAALRVDGGRLNRL